MWCISLSRCFWFGLIVFWFLSHKDLQTHRVFWKCNSSNCLAFSLFCFCFVMFWIIWKLFKSFTDSRFIWAFRTILLNKIKLGFLCAFLFLLLLNMTLLSDLGDEFFGCPCVGPSSATLFLTAAPLMYRKFSFAKKFFHSEWVIRTEV